jgi:hypothetical protein
MDKNNDWEQSITYCTLKSEEKWIDGAKEVAQNMKDRKKIVLSKISWTIHVPQSCFSTLL